MTERTAALMLTRFGLGARPGEITRVARDPGIWLIDQLKRPMDGTAALESLEPMAAIARRVMGLREDRRRARKATDRGEKADKKSMKAVRSEARNIYMAEVEARTRVAVTTDTPLQERLVHFWSNHFAVSTAKTSIIPYAGAFEREAIRPHILGRFADLLMAAERHPAMILYLDNHTSIGPNSPGGRRQGKGLNENLAREILELHTLGVNGGYTQDDVRTFAKVLTGWSVGSLRREPKKAGTFLFRDAVHEPGTHRLLGKAYREDGINQPVRVLEDLARHPATARFIATKMIRHFIMDDPEGRDVDAVAQVFRDSDGDLDAVTSAVLALENAWSPEPRKYKRPGEYVISALRGLGLESIRGDRIFASLEAMGERPLGPPGPDGWADDDGPWANPDGLMRRLEWAQSVGDKIGSRQRAPELLVTLLGPLAGARTTLAVSRAETAAQGIALALSAPEFMRR